MIQYIENNDLFLSKADALVNPVNCQGVMGRGIALEFKKRFPECVQPYKTAVASGNLVPGTLLYVHLIVQPDLFSMKRPAIILFPTKDHWRDNSKIEWIDKGLRFLRDHYRQWQINSIALPQIGCGLGGLPWMEVKQLIEQYLCNEPVDVEVYVQAEKMVRYFAYGSNMDKDDLDKWCDKKSINRVTFLSVTPAKLKDHKLSFNYFSTDRNAGAANIMASDRDYVYGLLIDIGDADLKTLRRKEGHPNSYKEIPVEVETFGGALVQNVKTYKAVKERELSSHQPPMREYLDLIIKSADKYNFPCSYVDFLKSVETK